MPVATRMRWGSGAVSMRHLSQTVKLNARETFHNLYGDDLCAISDNAKMVEDDKNGGPNNLAAWRVFREMTQTELANAVGTTPHQIHYLESGDRALSAKWLRKLAPALGTTPGHLLDHDPHGLPTDIVEMWLTATPQQRRQIFDITKTLVSDGTTG